MSVKGSQNYVWFLAERIGRGAMGNVYVARNRKKGSKFAAKVFTQDSKKMPKDYITVELQILEYLPRHENVIRKEAIEEETYSQDKVLIMELCEGGSVQAILDQPDNFYGLPEEEFWLIFQHVCEAIHHLFRNHVVHRDIKPGNILLYIAADGRHVYKIIDFGASKRLDQDDEGFKSLCGTEEYLHPKMHQAAFIRRIPGQVYGHTVDLWSFAITLYQCATGKLPFSPKAGIRQDRHMMQKLINVRAPDVISQVERSDGKIEGKTELPDTSRLSSGVREKLTEVLRRLLNVHQAVDPSRFFSEMHHFFQHIKVHVFSFERREVLSVFVQPNETLDQLCENIGAQLSGSASDKLFLAADGVLKDSNLYNVQQGRTGDLADSSPGEPIYVVSAAASESVDSKPTLPEVAQYDPGMNLSADGKFAKETCGNICYYKRLIENCRMSQGHISAAEKALSLALVVLCQNIEPVLQNQKKILGHALTVAERCRFRIVSTLMPCRCATLVSDECHRIKRAIENHYNLEKDFRRLHDAVDSFLVQTRKPTKPVCVTPSRCLEKAEKILNDARPMFETLRGDVSRELSHNDVEIHKYMRSEIKHACRRIKDIAENHCLKETRSKYSKAMENIRKMMATHREILEVQDQVKTYGDHPDWFSSILDLCDGHMSCQPEQPSCGVSMDRQDDELCLQSSLGELKAGLSSHQPLNFQDSGLPKSSANESRGVQAIELDTPSSMAFTTGPGSSSVALLPGVSKKGSGLDNLGFAGSDLYGIYTNSDELFATGGGYRGLSPIHSEALVPRNDQITKRTGTVTNSSEVEVRMNPMREPHGFGNDNIGHHIRGISNEIERMTIVMKSNNERLEELDTG